MKRIILGVILVVSCLLIPPSIAKAGEVEILVDKLVEKGVLTPTEARIILDETKKQVAEEIAEKKSSLSPSWTQTIKVKGDFRLRYQYQQRKGNETRNRGRVRYRLGIEANPVEKIKVAGGLASGGTDPRSTNQTFQNTFETPDIRLDYAYAEYKPFDEISLVGGIFQNKNYLWRPSDLLWDGDINPQGGAIHLQTSLMDADVWMNAGGLVLDESSSDVNDPSMWYVQSGTNWNNGPFDTKLAFTYYGIDVRKHSLDHSSGTNTLDNNGNLLYKYDSISPAAEFGVKEPLGLPLERVALFGEYVNALDPEDNNNGWLMGIKFGDKKVSKKGQWQGKYMYAELQKDAWVDAFPDSDRYDGDTGVKSHEAILEYALFKNVILGLDYYQSRRLASTKAPESIFQTDIVFKF